MQGAGVLSTQSEDAINFYEKIAGQSVFKENSSVVTTGHSLGGARRLCWRIVEWAGLRL